MIEAQTVREQASYGSFISSFTSEGVATNSTATNSQGATVVFGVDADSAWTYSFATDGGVYDNGDGIHGGNGGGFSFSTIQNLTMFSTGWASSFSQSDATDETTSIASTGFSFSDSAGFVTSSSSTTIGVEVSGNTTTTGSNAGGNGSTTNSYGQTWGIFQTATSSGVRNITSNVDTTVSQWFISGVSGRSFAATSSATTTALSNADSGGLITETYEATFNAGSTSSQEFVNQQEFGTIVSSERNDWLWKFNDSNTSYSMLSDIAETFGATTFFPTYSKSVVSYFVVGSDNSTRAFTLSQATTSHVIEFLTTGDAATTTLTSGDNLPRDTYSTTVNNWTTTSTSVSFGSSDVINDYSTYSFSVMSSIPQAITRHITYPFGLSDVKTTTILDTTSALATSTQGVAMPSYDGGGTSAGASAGLTVGQTILQTLLPIVSQLSAANTYVERVPPFGALIPPQYLQAGSNTDWASNLSFESQTIPFPFLSGVYSNVSLPGIWGTASTTGSNSDTWKYKWKTDSAGATLQYTHSSSGATSATVSSGTFANDSTITDSFYATNAAVFGGFGAIGTDAESAYFAARAAIGTLIDVNGSTTTYKGITTDAASSTMSGTMLVESPAQAFIQFLDPFGGGLPIIALPRN